MQKCAARRRFVSRIAHFFDITITAILKCRFLCYRILLSGVNIGLHVPICRKWNWRRKTSKWMETSSRQDFSVCELLLNRQLHIYSYSQGIYCRKNLCELTPKEAFRCVVRLSYVEEWSKMESSAVFLWFAFGAYIDHIRSVRRKSTEVTSAFLAVQQLPAFQCFNEWTFHYHQSHNCAYRQNIFSKKKIESDKNTIKLILLFTSEFFKKTLCGWYFIISSIL